MTTTEWFVGGIILLLIAWLLSPRKDDFWFIMWIPASILIGFIAGYLFRMWWVV